MSDGVYTRGGWKPLPADDAELHTPNRFRGFILIGALVGLAAALTGLFLMRRRGREARNG